jgi:hypothetical protein
MTSVQLSLEVRHFWQEFLCFLRIKVTLKQVKLVSSIVERELFSAPGDLILAVTSKTCYLQVDFCFLLRENLLAMMVNANVS